MAFASEADLEAFTLHLLDEQGIPNVHGSKIGPETPSAPRGSWRETILKPRLEAAVERLNPQLSPSARRDAVAKVADSVFPDAIAENRRLHELLVGGVPVEQVVDGESVGAVARLVDWDDEDNDWLAANQYDVVGKTPRTPDIVLFLNGLPVVVVELKGTEGKGLPEAYNQIVTYKDDIAELFRANLLCVVSDGISARYGSLSANFDRFMLWRTVDGDTLVPDGSALAIETLVRGLLNRATLLEMLRRFVVFEDEGQGPIKKIAGYHQFHAVRKGIASVLDARQNDGRGGVIWHTQGSGKSLLMAFFAGALMHAPALENPTIVLLTDRNDLDDQLFATFARCQALFGEAPAQAEDAEHLKMLLRRQIGGVIFTTIQKFKPDAGEAEFPVLTERSNVIVFVDEAHRSQYGFSAKMDAEGVIRYGFAHHLRRALPNATYVGFTGTPVELVNANTYAVFGDKIDVYDIAQAVADGATVPIYYEARVAKVEIADDLEGALDSEFEALTEGIEEDVAEATKRKWARIEALVGAEKRLDVVAADILAHFDKRQDAIAGKAMIVTMSRRIAVEVYNRIVAARPDWRGETDDTGAVKVVITGNATDEITLQPHIRSKSRLRMLRERYRKPADPFSLVIVCDMWLTGFDAPVMHTLYVDKPMKGHGLMQAIARVNRVFRNKPAGLVVDYIGLAADLKAALSHYSAGDRNETGVDTREAVAAFLSALDVLRTMFHGLDYATALGGSPKDRLGLLAVAIERALTLDGGTSEEDRTASRQRFLDATATLSKAFKLASGTPEAGQAKEEVAFFLAVQAALVKWAAAGSGARANAEADFAIGQLVNQAVASIEVVDLLAACGIDTPDIGVLSEEFLAEVRAMKQKNLAVEALKALLNGEIASRTRSNVVKHQEFSDRLKDAILRYHNRSVDALQVIQEMIELAKSLRDTEDDTLSEEERAFYDALANNKSAIEVLGNEELLVIAAELVRIVREGATVDWWRKENVRVKMRVAIRRILRKHGFPPDLQDDATKLILRQAEAMAVRNRDAA